jgi:YebC/PmpR family DNA-binding regulatory protein
MGWFATKRRVFMSGHSKWHSIKHKKAAADSKRGRIFTRLIKEMTAAARMGGGDSDANPRLRLAIATAKANNMPAENIKRAVMRGTGELPGVSYEDVNYEGYGPGGVAILVHVLTDNRNRTVAEIRHILSKNGGNLGETGCVGWMFEKKGYFVVEKAAVSEEKLLDIALGAGADDMRDDESNFEIFASPESFDSIKSALEAAGIPMAASEVSMVPSNYVKLEGKHAQTMIKLMETLEEHEDVQNVWANFDIDEAELKEAS